MKSIKLKGLALMGLSMLLAIGAMAQQTTEQRAARMTQDLKKELNLNEQQTSQVAEINRQTTQEMQQVRKNRNLTRQERRMQTQTIQEKRTAQIRAVLNEQQRTKFEQHQQVRQGTAKQRQNQQPKRQQPRAARRQGSR